jgi:hypothetical protein
MTNRTNDRTTFFQSKSTYNINNVSLIFGLLYGREGLYMGLISTKENLRHCFLY